MLQLLNTQVWRRTALWRNREFYWGVGIILSLFVWRQCQREIQKRCNIRQIYNYFKIEIPEIFVLYVGNFLAQALFLVDSAWNLLNSLQQLHTNPLAQHCSLADSMWNPLNSLQLHSIILFKVKHCNNMVKCCNRTVQWNNDILSNVLMHSQVIQWKATAKMTAVILKGHKMWFK